LFGGQGPLNKRLNMRKGRAVSPPFSIWMNCPSTRNKIVGVESTTLGESLGMIRRLSAEAFGTFCLVFGGCGSAVLAAGIPELGIGYAGVALAFGLTVLTMAYAVGHISGGHFNPAVSLGLAIAGRFEYKDLLPYWAAQLVGGILG